jgi:hypothetical protein
MGSEFGSTESISPSAAMLRLYAVAAAELADSSAITGRGNV